MTTRQAIVNSHDRAVIERYLPSNYYVIDILESGVLIEGEDVLGWTLDGYVIPRLASGWFRAEEVIS